VRWLLHCPPPSLVSAGDDLLATSFPGHINQHILANEAAHVWEPNLQQ
jgi:hypothetical protein